MEPQLCGRRELLRMRVRMGLGSGILSSGMCRGTSLTQEMLGCDSSWFGTEFLLVGAKPTPKEPSAAAGEGAGCSCSSQPWPCAPALSCGSTLGSLGLLKSLKHSGILTSVPSSAPALPGRANPCSGIWGSCSREAHTAFWRFEHQKTPRETSWRSGKSPQSSVPAPAILSHAPATTETRKRPRSKLI